MLGGGASAPRRQERPRDSALLRLKQASDQLRDPSSDGDILSLVLDFAAETFNRVAIFMLRDDAVAGIAQRGLDRAEGGEPGEPEAGWRRRAWARN